MNQVILFIKKEFFIKVMFEYCNSECVYLNVLFVDCFLKIDSLREGEM